eukprot:Colp12_sorted_trinity150504_noHs@25236
MKEEVKVIPDGLAKSGRVWKVKQNARSSAQLQKGVLSHLAKSFEQKEAERQAKKNVKELEREMIEEKKARILAEKTRREEQQKRRQENEYKNAVTQQLNPEKLKGMSKKQLRSVRKTSVNQFGQVELVNPYSGASDNGKPKAKKSGK